MTEEGGDSNDIRSSYDDIDEEDEDGGSGDDFSKESIEHDERRLTEVGRRTIELFVISHIFSSKIKVEYQEAVALKRQDELIREEEAEWMTGGPSRFLDLKSHRDVKLPSRFYPCYSPKLGMHLQGSYLKVIVGAHAVMANGGVIAPVGLNMVALEAQRHVVPFVVLAGIHKLCPLYPHNPEVLLNELKSPSELLDFGEFSDCMDFGTDTGSPLLQVVNPAFDYVPPKLVSLFITDTGGHNPSYMYRLIADTLLIIWSCNRGQLLDIVLSLFVSFQWLRAIRDLHGFQSKKDQPVLLEPQWAPRN
ncbi:translation initiation factor eIF-2B subunit beta [Tanacetum coccineum]|uniref:Translation initiation factor eIF2B subunit beta n=1 Tax=Tanacetum coccineum TaxID=301880 RepID=A0ABQ5DG00_9ASTR